MEQLRQEWRARRTPRNFQAALRFNADQLELGAGTVLAKTGATADVADHMTDQRLTALLSVAYGPVVAAGALGHVRAAIARRKAGDSAAADLHLALSRLDRLRHPEDASRRLFMADGLMRGGVSPQAIMDVLQDGAAEGPPTKKFSPWELRVPAGNGIQSGRWTAGALAGLSRFARMGPAALRTLGGFAADLVEGSAGTAALSTAGVAATLGILFIPSKGPKGRWVQVGGPADISYYQNPDELRILFKFTTSEGARRTVSLTPDHNGDYRDPDGNILARTLKAAAKTGVVVSTAELLGNPPGQPQLCPKPEDGRNQGPYGKAYEAYMKGRLNNPPTPPDLGYFIRDPISRKLVEFDDCDLEKPGLHEYKGPGYLEHMIKNDFIWTEKMIPDIQRQSLAQARAARGVPLTWSFAEEPVADYFKYWFKMWGEGRENIIVKHEAMPGHMK